jgi:hypothetical protein
MVSSRPRNRPTKLTPKTRDRFVEAISIGATLKMAASYAGIHYHSANAWLNRGSELAELIQTAEVAAAQGDYTLVDQIALTKEDKAKLDFYEAVEAATQQLGIECLQTMYSASRQDANWALRILQLKFPEMFPNRQAGRGLQVQTQVNPDGSVTTDIRVDDYVDVFREMADYERTQLAGPDPAGYIPSGPADDTTPALPGPGEGA